MEEYVSDTLKELGITANYLGYGYLKVAIARYSEMTGGNISITRIYKSVADKYNTSCQNVERCIRHAIETGVTKGDAYLWDKLFKCSCRNNYNKPTNKEFIATLAEVAGRYKGNNL